MYCLICDSHDQSRYVKGNNERIPIGKAKLPRQRCKRRPTEWYLWGKQNIHLKPRVNERNKAIFILNIG